jgi:hypothetical protein
MSLLEVLIEALIEDTNKYLNTITVHIHKQLDAGYDHVKNNRALEAQKAFANAENHWVARTEDVEQLKKEIKAINKLMTQKNYGSYTTKIKQDIACFHEAYDDLEKARETLDKVIKRTVQAASTREAADRAQLEADVENKQAFDEISALIRPNTFISAEVSETIEPPHAGASHDMFMLSAFITALGITAVAIAFAALNLAGLTMPGVVLGGFGFATTLLGCSMFASTATNIDEYMSNMTASFNY